MTKPTNKEKLMAASDELTDLFDKMPTKRAKESFLTEEEADRIFGPAVAPDVAVDSKNQPLVDATQSNEPTPSEPIPNVPKIGGNDLISNAADLSKSTPTTASAPSEDGLTDEQKQKRREVSAKWMVDIYDTAQSLGSVFAYHKFNDPVFKRERRDFLLAKVYAKKELSDDERVELEMCNKHVDGFMDRQKQFSEACGIDEENKAKLTAMMVDVFEVEDYTPDPKYILATALISTPMLNIGLAFKDKMVYNK